jgi:hypothetical protein
MTEDAKQLLDHLYETRENDLAGNYVSIGVICNAIGWDFDRTKKAADELVAHGYVVGEPSGMAVALTAKA